MLDSDPAGVAKGLLRRIPVEGGKGKAWHCRLDGSTACCGLDGCSGTSVRGTQQRWGRVLVCSSSRAEFGAEACGH